MHACRGQRCGQLGGQRYLWREAVRMDNARLTAVLGREPHTPLDEAVEATLLGLGCVDSARVARHEQSGRSIT